jgi:hypothetical protein
MQLVRAASVAAVVCLALSGCASVRSYVDPASGGATYQDVRQPAQPYKLKITSQLMRDGKEVKDGSKHLQQRVERIVQESKLAVPVTEGEAGELRIVLTNTADTGEAARIGFAAGFTLGLAGGMVTDYYEMDGELRLGDRTFRKQGYKHALHTTIGNKEGPPGVAPLKLQDAYDKVLEQLILNLLIDAQKEDFLTRANALQIARVR